MGFFRKSVDPELQALRESISNRGAADLAGASHRVEKAIGEALARSGVESVPGARPWLRDQLRFFLVLGTSPWLSVLQRLPDQYPQLEAEFRALVARPENFGPRDIVAWWWHLDRQLFEPLLENQFPSMIDSLAEGLAAAAERSGVDLGDQMIDWASVFE